MTEPVRTCAGCGRKAPQSQLVRFAASDGALVAGRGLPGRGVYTCRRLACFERAVARRAFARVLRRPVRIEPALTNGIALTFGQCDADAQTATKLPSPQSLYTEGTHG